MTSPPLEYGRKRKLWSVDEYLNLCALGVEDRVELVEGEIVEKMGRNLPHIFGLRAMTEALREVFGIGYTVCVQAPILVGDSMPEPDVYALRGSFRDYAIRYAGAGDVVIVTEIADESRLRFDREDKLRLYALAGFAEYWILNLVERRLEVYRKPRTDGTFGDVRYYGRDEAVAPLQAPSSLIRVAELLSPEEAGE